MTEHTTSESARGRRRLWGTIGTHLSALVAVQLILVLGLVGFAGAQDFRTARADAARMMTSTAKYAADFVAKQINDSRAQLQQIPQWADLLASPTMCQFTDPAAQQAYSTDGFKSHFYLLDRAGASMCPATKGTPALHVASAPWFVRAVQTHQPISTGPIADPSTGAPVLLSATTIPGHPVVVAFAIEINSIGPTLAKQFGGSSVKTTFIVTSRDRQREVSSSDGHHGASLVGTPFARTLTSESRTFHDLAGTERIFGEATVPAAGWHVVAGISTADALRAARQTFRDRIVLAALIVLALLLVAAVLQRRLARPIRSLARATKRIAEGELDAKVVPSGPFELRALADSFNTMADVRAKAESALRKAYRSEQRATEELREVDEMRQAFLMAISHELRTPLTSVVGFATFLKDAREDLSEEELDRAIDVIAKQSQRLERLLIDLLDIERLSRNTVEPNLQDVDVREVVMRAVERSSGAERISAPITKSVPAYVDPALVERMVENLVNNAVKHTPVDTKIWVRASRHNGSLNLIVEDNGPGVPDDLKLEIFEPFKQGDVPSHAPGTGVGLSLVSKFAKLHGGRAWVDDRRGGGASFHVELPAKHPEAKRKARRTSERAPVA